MLYNCVSIRPVTSTLFDEIKAVDRQQSFAARKDNQDQSESKDGETCLLTSDAEKSHPVPQQQNKLAQKPLMPTRYLPLGNVSRLRITILFSHFSP